MRITAAIGGGLLGLLAAAVLILFPERPWTLLILPVAGAVASLLGVYVAGEPSDELEAVGERLAREATRMAREAAELGSDGLNKAEAAEILRREASEILGNR